MTGDAPRGETRSPRAIFAERFADLYAAAGNPTLRRVAAQAENRMRAAAANPASAQRISDWKAGRNVPARFESLLPVVLTLVDLAKKRGTALPAKLADPQEWKRLWTASNSWTPDDADDSACPYLGLQSYRNTDSDIFFGRKRATEELTELVRNTARDGGGIVTLIGASGAGKSSLFAAGLSSELARGQGNWHIVTVTPGAHPMGALANTLGAPDKDAARTDSAKLAGAQGKYLADAHDLANLAGARGKGPTDTDPGKPYSAQDKNPADTDPAKTTGAHGGNSARADSADVSSSNRADAELATWPTDGPRLLIVDQFEELFTVCADEEERDEFLVLLDQYATQTDPVAVVLALRADFYARCLHYPVLQESLEKRSYLLGPMRVDELTEAITGPAERAGLKLEPGLDELVITELCGLGDHRTRQSYDPGALPLLSHVMAATWQHREGRKLTIGGYRAADGVVGSVAATAEQAWSELSDPQQSAAKDVLLGLVTVARDSRDTRRIAARPALQQRSTDPLSAAAALEALVRTRLVTLDADSVFLTHEIVLDAWPRLRAWIDENRVGYLVRQRVEADAVEWDSMNRDPALLYRGSRLEAALEHAAAAADEVVHDFLDASRTSRGRSRRRTTLTRLGLALAGVVLLVLGLTAYTQTKLAERQREEKNFAAVMTEAERLRRIDPSLSAQLYLVAERMRPGDEAVRTYLLSTQNQPLATIVPAHVNGHISVTQQPGGALLASVDNRGIAYLWDNSSPQHPSKLAQLPDEVLQAEFSSDRRVLATRSRQGSRLWDIAQPSAPRMLAELPQADAWLHGGMSFSADGAILATTNANSVTLWSVTDSSRPRAGAILPVRQDVSTHVLFSPTEPVLAVLTNNRLASAPSAGQIQLWRVDGPESTVPLGPPMEATAGELADVDFSPDGRILAIGTGDGSLRPDGQLDRGTVQLWRIGRDTPPMQLGAPVTVGESALHSVAFSPDALIFAVATSERVAVWNLADPAGPTLMAEQPTTGPMTCRYSNGKATPCQGGLISLTFGADGRTLTAGGRDGNLRVWSLPPALMPGTSEKTWVPQFDAAGHRAVVFSNADTSEIWDTRDPLRWRLLGRFARRPDDYRYEVSPDGATMVTVSHGGHFAVYDISDPANVRRRGDRATTLEDVSEFAIRPDWRIAVTSHSDSIRVWSLEDPGHLTPLSTRLPLPKADIEFSSDGKLLAVRAFVSEGGISQHSLRLWDFADPLRPTQLGDEFPEIASGINTVEFAPDGRTMILINNQMMQVWDIGDRTRIRPISAPIVADSFAVKRISFTADSRSAVIAGGDSRIALWDFTDRARPRQIGAPITPPRDGEFWTARFLPHGNHLIISGEGLRVWDLDVSHSIDRICDVTGSLLTEDLWQRHLPQLPYRPPCA
ncbi:NACHT and WD repeat domain-containing protein [Nocardia xishanensis]|uniref:NACHT and WD repeat domain-containing protein n=1 Tax=Nocardia xishanensis TaxID=238964 RepID=UPI003428383C